MDELVQRVREALAAEYPGAPNGRVRDVPDRRAIRWYTTIGLVDKPLGMRNRTALYGPRHLQQLVAIKRRQAEGRSLADIQVEFSWLAPEQLGELARVPDQLLASDGEPVRDHSAGAARLRFWADSLTSADAATVPVPASPALADAATVPVPTSTALAAPVATAQIPAAPIPPGPVPAASIPAEPVSAAPIPADLVPPALLPAAPVPADPVPVTAARSPSGRSTSSRSAAIGQVSAVPLGGGVILLVPGTVDDHVRDAIAAAATPLLTLLADRGLTDGSSS